MTVPGEDPRLVAAVGLIGRTGAKGSQLRYSDEEEPVVWMALADYPTGQREVAAALDPLRAVLRLCEALVDGGMCVHCRRPAGFEPDSLDSMPMDVLVCWYQWDPELGTFRRGCEGDDGQRRPGGPHPGGSRAARRRRR